MASILPTCVLIYAEWHLCNIFLYVFFLGGGRLQGRLAVDHQGQAMKRCCPSHRDILCNHVASLSLSLSLSDRLHWELMYAADAYGLQISRTGMTHHWQKGLNLSLSLCTYISKGASDESARNFNSQKSRLQTQSMLEFKLKMLSICVCACACVCVWD